MNKTLLDSYTMEYRYAMMYEYEAIAECRSNIEKLAGKEKASYIIVQIIYKLNLTPRPVRIMSPEGE